MNQLTGLIGVSLPAAPAVATPGVPAEAEEAAGALFAGLVAQQSLPAGEPASVPAAGVPGDAPAQGATVTELQMAAQLNSVGLTAQKATADQSAPAGDPAQSPKPPVALTTLAAGKAVVAAPVVQGQDPAPVQAANRTEGDASAAPTPLATTAAPVLPTSAGQAPAAVTDSQSPATYAPGSPSPASPSLLGQEQGQDQARTGGENPYQAATAVPAADLPGVETAPVEVSAAVEASASATAAATHESAAAPAADPALAPGTTAPRPAGVTDVQTAARPAPMADAPVAQAVRSQVLGGVEPSLAKGGMQDLTIQLDPEDLGRVEVRFQASGNRLAVTIVASGSEAEQVLRDGAKELGEAITQRSARFQNVDVRVETRENDDRDQQRQDNRREESARGSSRDQGDGRRRSTREPQTTAEAWADMARGG